MYLVDIKDATEEHMNDKNVITTNSAEESWDSSNLPGIKSCYALRGYKGGSQGKHYCLYDVPRVIITKKTNKNVKITTYKIPIQIRIKFLWECVIYHTFVNSASEETTLVVHKSLLSVLRNQPQ